MTATPPPAARAFPGHLGVEVFRPAGGQGGEYRTVYRFDSPAHLRAWLLHRWLYPDRPP
jgi:antibiotic biosynthesis monooxygenase (ABM) superfamily enzyme